MINKNSLLAYSFSCSPRSPIFSSLSSKNIPDLDQVLYNSEGLNPRNVERFDSEKMAKAHLHAETAIYSRAVKTKYLMEGPLIKPEREIRSILVM
jgi:hypothetical protein